MPQLLEPVADTNNPGLYTDQAGGAASIYLSIDEDPASDADFIESSYNASSAVYVTRHDTGTDPESNSGHIFRNRYQRDVANGFEMDLTFQLRQSYVSEASLGTLIVARIFTSIPTAWTADNYTLSAAEADSITDYSQLYNRMLSTQGS